MKSWLKKNVGSIVGGLLFFSLVASISISFVFLAIENRQEWDIRRKAAYASGAESRCYGVPATSNPYSILSTLKYNWIKGWAEAECVDGKVVIKE